MKHSLTLFIISLLTQLNVLFCLENKSKLLSQSKTNSETILSTISASAAEATSKVSSAAGTEVKFETNFNSKMNLNLNSNFKAKLKTKSHTITHNENEFSSGVGAGADFRYAYASNLNMYGGNKLNSFNRKSEAETETNLESGTGTDSSLEESLSEATENATENKKQPASSLGKDPSSELTYWEGWVSYIHYKGIIKKIPKKLFRNTEYFRQRIPTSTMNDKDKYGKVNIPDHSKWYLILKEDSIQIFTSRKYAYRNIWDKLEIKYIKPIPEDKYLKGGIHNIFDKSKIGYCFDLKVEKKGKRTSWLICLDDPKKKSQLLKMLIKLKLKMQRKFGSYESHESLMLKKQAKNLANIKAIKASIDHLANDRNKVSKSPLDGKWVLVWDWSQCSLKCGGGQSFQQWRCFPPKDGGKPCKGPSIRVRSCNKQKCPGINMLKEIKKIKPETLKPIVKVGPFSSRLQRYEKCIIKDNDAFYTKFNNGIESKFPIRIVMNNNTIALYKDDEYNNMEHTFKLTDTLLKIEKSNYCCFSLTDDTAEKMICGYEQYCDDEKNSWANGWARDFGLFKNSCRRGRFKLLTGLDEAKLKADLKKKIGDGMGALQRKKAQLIKEKLKMSSKSSSPIKKAQDDGFSALQKELQLEKLIKKEEMEKEKLELENITKKIKLEKQKADCLNRNIKEKKLDAQIMNERRGTENEAKLFRKEISQKVLKNRENFKKMIANMRKKAMLRKQAAAQQLKAVRAKMAANIEKANKMGDMKKCARGKTDEAFRYTYCDKVFVDDFVRNGDCKSEVNFCYTCCENEYGNIHIDKREICYDICDADQGKKKKAAPKKLAVGGHWMFK